MSDGDSCSLDYHEQGDDDTLARMRELMEKCFDDEEEFINYYFNEKINENKVLVARVNGEFAGMLHLCPREICVMGTPVKCYYLARGAVKKAYRDHGVMHSMVTRAMEDMRKEGCLFAYLVSGYGDYEELGFQTVCETVELDLDLEYLEDEDQVPDDLSGEHGYYMTRLREMSDEEIAKLAEALNKNLEAKYKAFARRSVHELKNMLREHISENGGVVAIFETGMGENGEDRLAGCFGYDVCDETMYVERFVSFDYNVRYTLDMIVRFAEQAFCRRAVVTMASGERCDDIYNMLGPTIRMEEGRSFMLCNLETDARFSVEELSGASFFDDLI